MHSLCSKQSCMPFLVDHRSSVLGTYRVQTTWQIDGMHYVLWHKCWRNVLRRKLDTSWKMVRRTLGQIQPLQRAGKGATQNFKMFRSFFPIRTPRTVQKRPNLINIIINNTAFSSSVSSRRLLALNQEYMKVVHVCILITHMLSVGLATMFS